MKKFLPIILTLFLAVLSVVGCDCGGDGRRLAKTPRQEYERLYSLVSEGRTFDFDEHRSFSYEAQGTLSGGNMEKSIQMDSLYAHEYKEEGKTSYARYTVVNTLFESGGSIDAYYDDDTESGFQVGPSGAIAYLESRYSDGNWSYPSEFGNGDYSSTLAAYPKSSDSLARGASCLLDPEYFESFDGAKSGGRFFVKGKVKRENIPEFAQWLDKFFGMFRLKDEIDPDREWKFFDLSRSDFEYSAEIEIRSTPSMPEEVLVSFKTVSDSRVDLGEYEFTARATFTSGGVKVKRLSYFDTQE